MAQLEILVAEDDEINREIIREILGALDDPDLVMACDGREALEACMSRRFDLLIFDRKMPFITGDKLIRHIRASVNVNSQTPAILFSASSQSEMEKSVRNCPADMILSKPIKADDFLSAVQCLAGAGPVDTA
ncbi:MAG: response regulator [Paracoccaceae bacterium]